MQAGQYIGKPSSLGGPQALVTDTIGYSDFFKSTATLYESPGSGYASGNNQYGDKAKAQVFIIDSTFILHEVLVWFGVKDANSGNSNSKISVKLHNLDGPGTTSVSDINDAPGSVINATDVLVSDISISEFTVVPYNNLILYGRFVVGLHFDQLAAGDTIGMYTTLNGDAYVSGHSWEKWSDNTWHTIESAWGLNVDFAIWPVIDASSSGIESERFFDGIKMEQNSPNPAKGVTVVQFELEKYTEELSFEIYDATGRKVKEIRRDDLNSGKHQLIINVADLSSGNYYYSIKTDTGRLTKKMLIAK